MTRPVHVPSPTGKGVGESDTPEQKGSAIRQRLLFVMLKIGEYCHSSEWAAVAPWVGTLVGSWIVGANTGSLTAVVVGALIAAVGCAPVAAAARWVRLQGAQTRRQDARERMVMQYCSLVLLPQLGKFSHLPRTERIIARDRAVMDAVNYLGSKVFLSDEDGLRRAKQPIRVVAYGFGNQADVLEVLHQAGRDDPATAFDLGRSERGIKVYNDLLSDKPTYESELTGRGYTSYVSAAVSSPHDIYGMITVDTTDVSKLSEEDGSSLEVIASALAVFYEEADREGTEDRALTPSPAPTGVFSELLARWGGRGFRARTSTRG